MNGLISEVENSVEVKEAFSTSYLDTIKAANTYNPEWTINSELQDRQEKIISELPPLETLASQMAQEIKKDRADDEIHSSIKNKQVSHQDLEVHLRSLIFEKIVQIEKRIYFSNEEPVPADLETTRWADQEKENAITEIIKHPPFDHLRRSRKTDLVGIQAREKDDIGQVDGGFFLITSTYEVKSGKSLDYRAYRQIKGGEVKTVEENMADFVKTVNNLNSEEAKKIGLEGMGKDGRKLMVLRRIRQHVVMPRNVDIVDLEKLINRHGHFDQKIQDTFTDQEFEDFKLMLSGKHPDVKVILRNSSFSSKELDKMRDQVLPLVKSLLEK